MSFSVFLCKVLNRLFPLPRHPFNLQNQGKLTYAEWQYDMGRRTIEFFLEAAKEKEMFGDKRVLDIGCGAGGKALYYASRSADVVYGIDTVEHYKEEAEGLARQKDLETRFRFVTGDAADMPFEDGFFDTIIMNDAMEHVDMPRQVLNECYRVLKPGGRVYINFPPYYHPYGAHLSDAIGIPWVHRIFGQKTLIKCYKDLVKDLPDGQRRIDFRIGRTEQGREYFSYINGMTIDRFEELIRHIPLKVGYYRLVPLRNPLGALAKNKTLREYFVKMVVCIMEKGDV
ncbi:MAG: class I SAM-dependent methyltransferase [Bacillota bacterium]|nr:class I SAM-dependent methyltransferase [Bacillota bacterium]MDD3298387.1 class I SAM-dependent methyltransferase [Bacillota bacterium]MDD3850696.1 class I SAM-dependent methyltransferase [Bacillota bacterium]MDD4707913.1 class I SAM-dependent methyltransferase [Bacillota bacterium]